MRVIYARIGRFKSFNEDDLEKVASGVKEEANMQAGTYTMYCPFCNTKFTAFVDSHKKIGTEEVIGTCSGLMCGTSTYFKKNHFDL